MHERKKQPATGRAANPTSRIGFLPSFSANRPEGQANAVITACVTTTHPIMNSGAVLALPAESISPTSGSIAALAK